MPSRPATAPRKLATQQRSRATVDALIEATARILVRDGYDKASTNRIAGLAGVSIGSLYQYFPSKEALVAAVIQRHDQALMRVVRRALAEVETLPVERAVGRLVAMAVEAHRVDPKLHRVLTEQTPRTGRLAQVAVVNREVYNLFRAYLHGRRDELPGLDLDLATYVCVTAVEALTHSAVLHRPDLLTDRGAAALTAEITRLVSVYLRLPPGAERRRAHK